MRRVTLQVDEWILQDAAAAIDTASVEETIHRALEVATEARRGERLERRAARLALGRKVLGRQSR